jgi:uncharacterized damage-inducible protein DinB
MSIASSLVPELEAEAATTRRLLERVPEDKLGWKPHEKSMSLAVLANHVAGLPGFMVGWAAEDTTVMDTSGGPQAPPTKVSEILKTHDDGLAKAKAFIAGLDDSKAMGNWSLVVGGNPVVTVPRIGLLRSFLINHWIHHRGQLSVYLRLLNVPVPSIYGPSADENPMM